MSDESGSTALATLPNVDAVLDHVASEQGYGEGPTSLPSRRELARWREDCPEFARLFARARVARADAIVDRGTRWLLDCDPEKGDPKTASARVSLAQYRAAHDRWLAGCLDRETYGEKVSVDAKVQSLVVTLPLDLMLPTPTADAGAGAGVDDARVAELRRAATARPWQDAKP